MKYKINAIIFIILTLYVVLLLDAKHSYLKIKVINERIHKLEIEVEILKIKTKTFEYDKRKENKNGSNY